MEDIQKKYSLLYDLNISRETCIDFESLITMIQDKNQEINIVSKETAKDSVIRERHIIDSAQIYDLIDLNHNTTIDLGTGGGMPGIVVAIIMKNLKKNIKINLYEKSHHKSFFLREVSRKLELKTEVFEENIFDVKGIETGSIMARAFKPIPVILDLVHSNFKSFENIIIFMGKNGKEILKETLKGWDLEYTEKKSLTSEESFLLNIKNKNKN